MNSPRHLQSEKMKADFMERYDFQYLDLSKLFDLFWHFRIISTAFQSTFFESTLFFFKRMLSMQTLKEETNQVMLTKSLFEYRDN